MLTSKKSKDPNMPEWTHMMRDLTPELPGEIWSPEFTAAGGETFSASSLGRIKSTRRNAVLPQYFAKVNSGPRPYYQAVTGYRAGGPGERRTYRLYVGKTVLVNLKGRDPDPEKNCACHKNDLPGDNTLENLYWNTVPGNRLDFIRNHGQINCPPSRGRRSTREFKQEVVAYSRQTSVRKAMLKYPYKWSTIMSWRKQFPEVDSVAAAA